MQVIWSSSEGLLGQVTQVCDETLQPSDVAVCRHVPDGGERRVVVRETVAVPHDGPAVGKTFDTDVFRVSLPKIIKAL